MDLTTLVSISITAALLLLVLALTFGRFLGWQLTTKQKESVKFQSPHVPRAKIRDSIAELGWTMMRDQPRDMMARTRTRWRSWGEFVTLEFHDGGADIESRCFNRWQAVDWGKNRTNVQRLVEALEKRSKQSLILVTQKEQHNLQTFQKQILQELKTLRETLAKEANNQQAPKADESSEKSDKDKKI